MTPEGSRNVAAGGAMPLWASRNPWKAGILILFFLAPEGRQKLLSPLRG
jgi:hypothetical protein